MKDIFGTSRFSDLTGISRQTLGRMHVSGDIPAKINAKGQRTYCVEDFFLPYVKKHMEFKGLLIPDEVKFKMLGIDKPKLKAVAPKPSPVKEVPPAKVLPFTSDKKLKAIPNGIITEKIKPLADMTPEARAIWEFTMDDLIEFGSLRKCDLYIFKNYCMGQAQITEMENQMGTDFIDAEGRPNPLMGSIEKTKSNVKAQAHALHITPQGRKDMKLAPKVSSDQQAWDKVLSK